MVALDDIMAWLVRACAELVSSVTELGGWEVSRREGLAGIGAV